MKINIPFYPNPDETHCFQACLKMVLKYFEPDKDYSWEKLDKISAKKRGKWTWPTAALLFLIKNGYQVKVIENYDYLKFIETGMAYQIEKYGKSVANEQIKNSDIGQERLFMKEFLKIGQWQQRIPAIKDIKNFLTGGYLVTCNLNSRILENMDGYEGHFIIITGFSQQNLFLHDPYSPKYQHRVVTNKLFNSSWAYPTKDVKNIIAIKRRG